MALKKTLTEILASANPDSDAILTSGKKACSYAALSYHIQQVGGAIRSQGIEPGERVAIVLPNGPEMATAFLAVAAACVAAPLNPAYKQEEFEFYMEDLGTKLLMTDGPENPAAAAAHKLGIPVTYISMDADAPAGVFNLDIPCRAPLDMSTLAPEHEALVLHTSGTTSRPKIVPLSQANISASAFNISESLALSSDDVCLNIMPLFHIHGLIAAVLSSLQAGASIFCTSGFNAMKVFGWFDEAKPTWYTAVPTMHQTIVARASRNPEILQSMRLRLIRSSSSSLPPQVMKQLEDTFGCPVVEAYGMTEAAHQMSTNPLGMGTQKPGSVGKPAGPKVAIMSESQGLTSQADVLGEIVISGPNVTAGYEANEKANAENFFADPQGQGTWFRTGDQGKFDEEGYLYITGRLKEIINRGGEKISPREVDEILMDHPAVDQAVTFALPHKQLGEDVACVIVLKEGQEASEADIRNFASQRLASFKVPRKVLFLDEIPKGATGKLQRIGLADKLGLTDQ